MSHFKRALNYKVKCRNKTKISEYLKKKRQILGIKKSVKY